MNRNNLQHQGRREVGLAVFVCLCVCCGSSSSHDCCYSPHLWTSNCSCRCRFSPPLKKTRCSLILKLRCSSLTYLLISGLQILLRSLIPAPLEDEVPAAVQSCKTQCLCLHTVRKNALAHNSILIQTGWQLGTRKDTMMASQCAAPTPK